MWIRGIGALVTLVGSTLCADETGGQIERSATVCMLGGHPLVMEYARNLVSKTFAGIDVKIDWRWRKCPAGAIRITLQARTPLHQRPGALTMPPPVDEDLRIASGPTMPPPVDEDLRIASCHLAQGGSSRRILSW